MFDTSCHGYRKIFKMCASMHRHTSEYVLTLNFPFFFFFFFFQLIDFFFVFLVAFWGCIEHTFNKRTQKKKKNLRQKKKKKKKLGHPGI